MESAVLGAPAECCLKEQYTMKDREVKKDIQTTNSRGMIQKLVKLKKRE